MASEGEGAVRLRVPPKKYWPIGMKTDWISAHPDRLLTHEAKWLSIKPAAWFHDAGYFLGYIIHRDLSGPELRCLAPRPNDRRSNAQRKAIDAQFYAHLRELGVDRWYAWVMYRTVRLAGGRSYWLQYEHWSRA